MKYIVFWEFCPDDTDKVIAKQMKMTEEREKEADKYPKYLFPPQWTGQCKGFSIVEVADPKQFRNSNIFWFPEMKLKFVPCDDVSEWIALYMKQKK